MSIVQTLSPTEAQRLTQQIKVVASSVRDGLFKLRNLVEEAKNSNAWQVLGFRSWTEYLVDTLGAEPMRLARDERQELVEYLSGEGMSTRAIAPIVGAARNTVVSDLRQVAQTEPPVQTMMRVDAATGEVSDVPARHVTGVDGKEYAVPYRDETPVIGHGQQPLTATAKELLEREGFKPSRSSRDVEIINDIRLYLRHIATKPEIANLPPAGKQHIIDALHETITALERN